MTGMACDIQAGGFSLIVVAMLRLGLAVRLETAVTRMLVDKRIIVFRGGYYKMVHADQGLSVGDRLVLASSIFIETCSLRITVSGL